MLRLGVALLVISLALKSDAQTPKVDCQFKDIQPDKYGCVDLYVFEYMMQQNCGNIPPCFKIEYQESAPKEYFPSISKKDKKNIIETLDSSAVALLKNSKLKNIKIIFFNKGNKLGKEFLNDAERYLLEKGVKKGQFKIEIRQ